MQAWRRRCGGRGFHFQRQALLFEMGQPPAHGRCGHMPSAIASTRRSICWHTRFRSARRAACSATMSACWWFHSAVKAATNAWNRAGSIRRDRSASSTVASSRSRRMVCRLVQAVAPLLRAVEQPKWSRLDFEEAAPAHAAPHQAGEQVAWPLLQPERGRRGRLGRLPGIALIQRRLPGLDRIPERLIDDPQVRNLSDDQFLRGPRPGARLPVSGPFM
jgi:hypothetical protein